MLHVTSDIWSALSTYVKFVTKNTFEDFLNPFAKGLAQILPITVCDGTINLEINTSTCDFCQIFLLDKICYFDCDFEWFTKDYQMYIYCIYLFRSLFIIPSQSIIGIGNPW